MFPVYGGGAPFVGGSQGQYGTPVNPMPGATPNHMPAAPPNPMQPTSPYLIPVAAAAAPV